MRSIYDCVKIMQKSSAADSVWTRTCTSIGEKCVLQTLFLFTKNALSNVNDFLWAGHGTGENGQGLEFLIRSVKVKSFDLHLSCDGGTFIALPRLCCHMFVQRKPLLLKRLLFHSSEDLNGVFSYDLSNFVFVVSLKISI